MTCFGVNLHSSPARFHLSANSAAPREISLALLKQRDEETKSRLGDWILRAAHRLRSECAFKARLQEGSRGAAEFAEKTPKTLRKLGLVSGEATEKQGARLAIVASEPSSPSTPFRFVEREDVPPLSSTQQGDEAANTSGFACSLQRMIKPRHSALSLGTTTLPSIRTKK